MKRCFLGLIILALTITACKPDIEPGAEPNGGEMNDTTETEVKKYLVKQLLNDDPERIMLAIEWNDDCSKILHVKHGTGYGSCIEYDFSYYDDDSIRVELTLPAGSYPIWEVWYDCMIIHLKENKIDSICCYKEGSLKDIEHYYYNEEGKLAERKYFGDATDFFKWENDDVVEYSILGHSTVVFKTFTSYIHPHYTLPFYLSNEAAFEVRRPLFGPFWKHQPIQSNYNVYEADEDGYITKMTHKGYADSLNYYVSYYYKDIH